MRNLKRPSPGTVLGTIALIVAIGGNSNAFSSHILIRKGEIAPGAVTAKTLAKGAVHPRAIAKGAITSRALKPGAVTSAALAPDSVMATAIAPGSVYGGALGPVTTHGTKIADIDTAPANIEWTAGNSEVALCSPGERLLTGGIVFTNPGNREVGVIESLPFSNSFANGITGRITSNSGGSAVAEVQAICLK